MDKLVVFSGNANQALTKEIADDLGIRLGDVSITRFSDGEISVKINENIRGKDVFIVQPTSPPSNDNLIELLILIDAAKRASAGRITAVVPYYGYARQDRKDQPRVPITAKLVANLLVASGIDRLLTIDLHAGQIQGFFDVPVDHLYAVNVFVDYFLKHKIKNLVVVSPDVGGIKMARAYAKRLGALLAIVDKRRISDTQAEVMHILGEVKGKNVVLVDDLIATGGTIKEAAVALSEKGAKDIYAAVTHPVLCGAALKHMKSSPLKELVVTNTISLDKSKIISKIKVLSVAHLLSEAIKRIHSEESVSSLFDPAIKW